MIFSDKVIRLRKKNGWSQEELAARMEVSRQTVSKWESAQAIPEIGKILQLANLFGVTTDYLLKDELEMEEFSDAAPETAVRRVTLAEAGAYLKLRKRAALRIALATFLCILSPIPLMILGVLSEMPECGISSSFAAGAGMIALFLFVVPAVAIFIHTGFLNAPYEFLDKGPFDTEYGVRGMVEEKRKAYRGPYSFYNVIAASLCVLSPVPIFLSLFQEENDLFAVVMLCITILTAGIGVALFLYSGVQMAALQRLLKEGDFSESEKKVQNITGPVSTVYWLLLTAVYLAVSFLTNRWESTWILWAVGGVLYAAILCICKLIVNRKK